MRVCVLAFRPASIVYIPLPQIAMVYFGGLSITMIMLACGSLIAYGAIFSKIYRQNRTSRVGGNSQVKLTVYGLSLSCSLSFMALCSILTALAEAQFSAYFYLWNAAVDLFYLANPYLLLVCSSLLRREILGMVFGYGKSTSVTTIKWGGRAVAVPSIKVTKDPVGRSERRQRTVGVYNVQRRAAGYM